MEKKKSKDKQNQNLRVLVIKLGSLGDLLATTANLQNLIKYNDVIVDHLVAESCQKITRNHKALNKMISIPDVKPRNLFGNMRAAVFAAYAIFNGNYDKIVLLHKSLVLRMLCRIFSKAELTGIFSSNCKFLHQSVRYDNTLNRSIFEKQVFERAGFRLPTPTALSYTIETSILPNKILSSLPCSRFISINVGGGNFLSNATNRLWPKEYFFRLINILKEPVVLLGQGSPDEDIGKWIEKQNGGRLQIRNLINKTTLDQTAEIIRRSDLYIGNDSALMFLAAAVNTASLGLYGPTQAEVASPLGQNVYFLEATGECVRCYDPDDGIGGRMYTCNNNICMQSIPPEHVAVCARSILERL